MMGAGVGLPDMLASYPNHVNMLDMLDMLSMLDMLDILDIIASYPKHDVKLIIY